MKKILNIEGSEKARPVNKQITSGLVHNLTQRQIFKKALSLRATGRLYDRNDAYLEDSFSTGIDRFVEIAFRLKDQKRILDVGPGSCILVALLSELGHTCHVVDLVEFKEKRAAMLKKYKIEFSRCNVEVDNLPYPEGFFDAVTCCQALEHFTHSHLKPIQEFYRVLRKGGIVEIDVPNVACFRNRLRLLRGKHITWDYQKHYLYAEPVVYKGVMCYPDRHNREFTKDELELLIKAAGFINVEIGFLKQARYREGFEKLKSIGSGLRNIIPSTRKGLIGFGEKP